MPTSPVSPESFYEKELPTNVTTMEQLMTLPAEFRSGDPERPLRYEDDRGNVYTYALQPMKYSVTFILLVEFLERFTFYGLNYTQCAFLTGVYNEDWNAGMSSVAASSYVSVAIAIAYTAPFCGAFLADSLGEYTSILIGVLVFYLPGVLIIVVTTVPHLTGAEFDTHLLKLGLLVLWPLGMGIIKSIVNVFGAKQHHPILHFSLVESYYVSFYVCINMGAVLGGILVPIIAQHNVTVAYMIPVGMLGSGLLVFVAGTRRYVKSAPSHDLCPSLCPKSSSSPAYDNDDDEENDSYNSNINGNNNRGLWTIFKISALIIPFNIAYSQMATSFIIQGTVMEKAFGFIDAASMNYLDALSVLSCGYLVAEKLYPALAKRGIKIPTTYKFAMGSGLGALSILNAIWQEHRIHAQYHATGEKISVLWQSFSFLLIGAGEIFAVSTAYEIAFTAAPPSRKVLASAVNLFCLLGLPNFFCIGLYHICQGWFINSNDGTAHISTLEDYAAAHVVNYFWVLFGIASFGVFFNLLPPVRDFVASVEENISDSIKTPVLNKTPRGRRALAKPRPGGNGEKESLLLAHKIQKHKDYMTYGKKPIMVKHASMRAGPSLRHIEDRIKGARRPTYKVRTDVIPTIKS
eukprot:scaffold20416_cov51-Attheya_sp.AAC.2